MPFPEGGPRRNTRPILPADNLSVAYPSAIKPESGLFNGKLSGLELAWSPSEETTQTGTNVSSSRRKLGVPQVVKNIYHRGNLEGFGTALGIDALSTAYLWLSIPALTAVINTAASLTDFQLAVAAAATVGGALGLKSLRKDAQTLSDKHFGTNTFGTAAYAITGKPRLSALIDHALGYSFVAVGNPVGIASLLTGDKSLLSLDFLATSIALPIWYFSFNSIIDCGGFDGIINPIREKRHAAWNKLKQKIKR